MSSVDSPRATPETVAGVAYETLLELGQGGMGSVVLARATGAAGFERLVALKRMRPELMARPELVTRFADEARVAAHVRHANVVSVHHFGQDADGYFLVLDYVEGTSLDALIGRTTEYGGRVPPPVVMRIVNDALAGLHAVHEATDTTGRALQILHRDVSPPNVLVGRDGIARLTDFGVARSAIARQVTDKHRLLGKLLYMSPEYLRQDSVDRRLDIYAMGMTLRVALTGVEPWAELSDHEVVSRIRRGDLPTLAKMGLDVAPELEALVLKASAFEPKDRFETAARMQAVLERLGRDTGWMATHAEVAEFVEQLVGSQLNEVRTQVASRVSFVRTPPPPRTPAASPASEAATEVARAAGPLALPSRRKTEMGVGIRIEPGEKVEITKHGTGARPRIEPARAPEEPVVLPVRSNRASLFVVLAFGALIVLLAAAYAWAHR